MSFTLHKIQFFMSTLSNIEVDCHLVRQKVT